MSNFNRLSEISGAFEKRASPVADDWAGSPFKWILSIPSRSKGSYGELFVAELFRANGFDVKRPLSGSDHDRVINGHRIEIKMSTRWAENGQYKFQQIRDQKYDFVLCLGISPKEAHCWLIPKAEVHLDREGVTNQHGGKAGSDTMWLAFPSTKPPAWLNEFGGNLEDAIALMRSKGKGSYDGKPLKAKDKVWGGA